jgi:LmbE family N-acetylglucosaminyl deacetylase
MQSIIVFCAHPDDEVLGVGGTIAKYAREGTEVVTVIFSSGAQSHPWMKRDVTVETRKKETKKSASILGTKITVNLGLRDGTLLKQVNNKKVLEHIVSIVMRYRPEKIFTHAVDDPHPDHHAVYKIVNKVFGGSDFQGNIYSFHVWNPLNVMKRKMPKMYVDISATFKTKIKALKCFKSQKLFILPLLPATYLRAVFAGFQAGCRYAEAFYIVR